MRVSTLFKEYIEIQKQYEQMGKPLPLAIQHEYESKMFIENLWRTLIKYADGGAIPKAGWEWVDNVCEKNIFSDISQELRADLEIGIDEVRCFRKVILSKPELLIDGHTLSKEGRKRLRKTCDIIGMLHCKS